MNLSNEYTGHCKSGGLQQHSVGDLFPYTVIGTGDGRWCAFDTRTGNEGDKRLTYKEAEIDVHALRLRNMMHS